MGILRRFKVKSLLICASIALAILGIVSIVSQNASATVSADNFHVTNVHAFGGHTTNDYDNTQLDGQDPVTLRVCRSNNCTISVRFDWSYESTEPIALNDTISVDFAADQRRIDEREVYNWGLTTAAYTNVYDGENNLIFKWRVTSGRKLQIVFLEGAVGKTSFGGTLQTAKTILAANTSAGEDFELSVGSSEVINIPVQGTTYYKVSAPQVWINNTANDSVSWRIYAPIPYTHDFYTDCLDGGVSRETTLDPEKEMHNLVIEQFFDSEALSLGTPSIGGGYGAFSTSPADDINGTVNGMSSMISLYAANNTTGPSLYSVISQQNGESYEDFKARITNTQYSYGIYTNAQTGLRTMVTNLGDYPVNPSNPNKITLEKLFAKTSYENVDNLISSLTSLTRPRYEPPLRCLFSDNYNNNTPPLAYISVREYIDPDSGIQSITHSMTYTYTNGNGVVVRPKEPLVRTIDINSVPQSIVSEVGALRMVVADATSGAKIQSNEMTFKLQRQNGSNWEDVGDLQKNSSGEYGISGLNAGTTYRVVETQFPTGYNNTSLKLYSDNTHTTEIANASFVASQDSGTVIYATNAKQKYTITFDPGEGTLADRYRNQTVEYGTNVATLDPSGMIGLPIGKVFDKWTPTLDGEIVTGNKTYTATYKNAVRVIRARVDWMDAGNEDGVRPDSLTLSLIMKVGDNARTYDISKTASAANNYTVEWADMNTHSGTTPIEYSVEGATVTGYTMVSSIDSSNYHVVTATHSPQVHIEIEKDWDDDDNRLGARPSDDEVSFEIMAGGRHTGRSFTLAEGRSGNLNKYSDLTSTPTKINYSLAEIDIHGYENVSIQKISEQNNIIKFLATNRKITLAPLTVDNIFIHVDVNDDALDDDETISANITPRNETYPTPENTTVDVNSTGDVDFGPATYTEPGEYEYDITIDTSNHADVGVDDITVTVKVNVVYDPDTDSLVSTTKYYIDGEEVDPSALDVVVRHLDPFPHAEDFDVDFHAEDPIEERIIATLYPITDGAPMPEGSDDGLSTDLAENGLAAFGELEFTEPGEYEYGITLDSDAYDLEETEFIIRVVTSINKDTNQIQVDAVMLCDKDGNPIDMSSFKLGLKRKESDAPEVTPEEIPEEPSEENPENPNTGDNVSMFLLATLSVTGLGFGVIRMSKRSARK